MSDSAIVEFFSAYAYQPLFVYSFIVVFMTASSFGLPIPEEVTLVSAGLVAYMARHPAEFPPPSPDAQGVDLTLLAIICLVAVLGSDIFIYMLGRTFGRRIVRSRFFDRLIGKKKLDRIERSFQKYKYWASGLFRFTPGVRFPGHMSCGMLGVPLWVFVLVDGSAALISVPTQVLLVAYFGDVIIDKLTRFKLIIGSIIALLLCVWIGWKIYQHLAARKRAKTSPAH
ncbi:MAG: DedA family protein [Deltaproteobacteria bacterium]|nr:DedA family protein [Deltaproteobacteria bacterium]